MAHYASYYLFVYGSLRSGFQSPAYDYISRYFNLFGPAKVKGRLYDTGDYPAAAPVQDEAFIHGELYLVKNENEFSWAIAQLDDYEGIVAEDGEPLLYRREITDVFINDAIVPAWIYWYSGDLQDKPLIASGDILEYLRNKKQ